MDLNLDIKYLTCLYSPRELLEKITNFTDKFTNLPLSHTIDFYSYINPNVQVGDYLILSDHKDKPSVARGFIDKIVNHSDHEWANLTLYSFNKDTFDLRIDAVTTLPYKHDFLHIRSSSFKLYDKENNGLLAAYIIKCFTKYHYT
jgi:hypothetical protein